jgi:hypothetical protein
MGLLALMQLAYFAKSHTERARWALAESVNPTRAYFPFAATGVNLTFFLMELAQQHMLHAVVLQTLDSHGLSSTVKPGEEVRAESSALVTMAVNSLHDMYADIFCQFIELWLLDNPKDLMQFPDIFARFKLRFKQRLLRNSS